jgi:hypothetical protein
VLEQAHTPETTPIVWSEVPPFNHFLVCGKNADEPGAYR